MDVVLEESQMYVKNPNIPEIKFTSRKFGLEPPRSERSLSDLLEDLRCWGMSSAAGTFPDWFKPVTTLLLSVTSLKQPPAAFVLVIVYFENLR